MRHIRLVLQALTLVCVHGHGRLTLPAARNSMAPTGWAGVYPIAAQSTIMQMAGHEPLWTRPWVGLNAGTHEDGMHSACGTAVSPEPASSSLPPVLYDMNLWDPTPKTFANIRGKGVGQVQSDVNGNPAVLHVYENKGGSSARVMIDITAQHIGFFEFSLCPCNYPGTGGVCPDTRPSDYDPIDVDNMLNLQLCFSNNRLKVDNTDMTTSDGLPKDTKMVHAFMGTDDVTPQFFGAGVDSDKYLFYDTDGKKLVPGACGTIMVTLAAGRTQQTPTSHRRRLVCLTTSLGSTSAKIASVTITGACSLTTMGMRLTMCTRSCPKYGASTKVNPQAQQN